MSTVALAQDLGIESTSELKQDLSAHLAQAGELRVDASQVGRVHTAAIQVLCAFVLYRRFVFRVTGHVWLDLARFEVVNLASLAVNSVALPFVVEVIGLTAIPAQLLITSVTMLISVFGHRGFSFRRSPQPTA